MNEFWIGAMRVPGGYVALLRKVHKSESEPIKGKGGFPVVYQSKAEAKAAAGDAMMAYLNSHIVRDGETLSTGLRAAADAIFKKGQ